MKKYNDYFFKNQNKFNVIVMVADARAPISTVNFDIYKQYPNHIHILVLSKKDLADLNKLKKFIKYFNSKGIVTIGLDLSKSLSKSDYKQFFNKLFLAYKIKKIAVPLISTILVVGLPNIGKSTLINRLVKKNVAIVGNRPGVTKHPQILKINEEFYIFDFPGITFKKFSDNDQWIKSALVNILPKKILEPSSINNFAYNYLKKEYPVILKDFFHLTYDLSYSGFFQQLKKMKKFNTDEATESYIFQMFKKIKHRICWDNDYHF